MCVCVCVCVCVCFPALSSHRVSSTGCVMRMMMKISRRIMLLRYMLTFFYPALVNKVFMHV